MKHSLFSEITFKKVAAYTVAIAAGGATFGFSALGARLMSNEPALQHFLAFVSLVSVSWSIQGFTHTYDRFHARQPIGFFLSLTATCFALGYTGWMASHFLETKWGDVRAERQQIVTINNDIQRKYRSYTARIEKIQTLRNEKHAELGWIPKDTRPPSVVDAEIDFLKTNFRWKSTEGCTPEKITKSESREFCKHYGSLKVELQASIGRKAIQAEIREFTDKIDGLHAQLNQVYDDRKQAQVVGEADAAASFFVRVSNGWVNEKQARDIQIIWAVITLLLLESTPIPIARSRKPQNPPKSRNCCTSIGNGVVETTSDTASGTIKPKMQSHEPIFQESLAKTASMSPAKMEDGAGDNQSSFPRLKPKNVPTPVESIEKHCIGTRQEFEVKNWLANQTCPNPNGEIEINNAWKSFESYQKKYGSQEYVSQQNFKRIMKSKLGFETKRREVVIDGEKRRIPFYQGLSLNSE